MGRGLERRDGRDAPTVASGDVFFLRKLAVVFGKSPLGGGRADGTLAVPRSSKIQGGS